MRTYRFNCLSENDDNHLIIAKNKGLAVKKFIDYIQEELIVLEIYRCEDTWNIVFDNRYDRRLMPENCVWDVYEDDDPTTLRKLMTLAESLIEITSPSFMSNLYQLERTHYNDFNAMSYFYTFFRDFEIDGGFEIILYSKKLGTILLEMLYGKQNLDS